MTDFIFTIAIYAIPTILAITMHEAAHGFAAKLFGDRTAEYAGRLTLNPIAHIDPAGTFIVPGLLLVGSLLSGTSGILFGWAKPVPVNFMALSNPKRDMIWVALAGPASNLAQAMLWALSLRLIVLLPFGYSALQFLIDAAVAGVNVNLVLMAFNLIPILPLDGGRILTGLLPMKLALAYAQFERYGMIVMIAIVALGLTSFLIRPFLQFGHFMISLVL